MSHSEVTRMKICPKCGKTNHVIIGYAGDGRGNEGEKTECYNCGATVDEDKCFAIFSGKSAADALLQMRQMQGRAPR